MHPRPLTFISLMLALCCATAEPEKINDPKLPPPITSAQDAAAEQLLNQHKSIAAFNHAADQARKAGVPEQAITEARFLYHVDRNDDSAVAAMVPELLKLRDSFKDDDTIAFASKDDCLAIIEYAQALAALNKNDKAGFKSHITEAFWLSPQQGPAFTPHIERFRLKEAMLSIKIDLSTTLTPAYADEKSSSLKQLAGDGKGLLLHFWSADSAECVDTMPDFLATASSLAKAGIIVITVMPATAPENLTKTRKIIAQSKTESSKIWMFETLENKLSHILRVKNLPTFALISGDGSVLFNGSPADPDFWTAAAVVNPSVKRPDSPVRNTELEEK